MFLNHEEKKALIEAGIVSPSGVVLDYFVANNIAREVFKKYTLLEGQPVKENWVYFLKIIFYDLIADEMLYGCVDKKVLRNNLIEYLLFNFAEVGLSEINEALKLFDSFHYDRDQRDFYKLVEVYKDTFVDGGVIFEEKNGKVTARVS